MLFRSCYYIPECIRICHCALRISAWFICGRRNVYSWYGGRYLINALDFEPAVQARSIQKSESLYKTFCTECVKENQEKLDTGKCSAFPVKEGVLYDSKCCDFGTYSSILYFSIIQGI